MGTTRIGAHAPEAVSAHAAATVALGRRIHDLRAARGFSLQEFALLAGLTAPVLSALERGDEHAPLVALIAAADALDLPLARVVAEGRADPPPPASTPHPVAVEHGAPHGYVPLEMPELWEPPHPQADGAYDAPPLPAAPAPHREAVPAYVTAETVPVPTAPVRSAPRGAMPRTFADLRKGVLADRSFATLPEFAVAAVVEAGHPVAVVASIFRVPSWRLDAWVRDGVTTPAAPAPFRRTR
jgi:transcriptional regulator with XRE-family HTH domain